MGTRDGLTHFRSHGSQGLYRYPPLGSVLIPGVKREHYPHGKRQHKNPKSNSQDLFSVNKSSLMVAQCSSRPPRARST